MPSLDRRITVQRTVGDYNVAGEFVEETTDYPVWATRIDASAIDAETAGGSLSTSTRTYVIRWRREIAEAPVGQLSVIEGGLTLNALNIIEQQRERDNRRRFLRIEAIGEVTA